ncbi:DUF4255 domain-containing protein [Streptomyces xiamenensis]
MIHEVDEVLKGLLGGGALTGSGIDVSFEVPSRDWAARRNGPVINAYLYDIREDTSRRHRGQVAVRDDRDITVKRRETPRWLRLSYLVTAWTKQPEDEHRLLSAVLATLLPRDTLHPSELPDSLRALGMPVPLTVAGPHGEARSLADIWSALGGELKPSVDVTLTAPFPLSPEYDVAPPIEQAMVRVRGMSDEAAAVEERTHRPEALAAARESRARQVPPVRRTRVVRRERST